MDLVNNIFGTQLNDGVQLAIVFGTLLILLLLVVWLFRTVFGNKVTRMAKNRQPRLAVTDAAIVDDKRRLVLVRRDNVEHLLLIGGSSDVLVESNISRVTPVQVPGSAPAPQAVAPQPTATPTSTSIPEPEPAPEPIKSKSTKTGFAAKIGAATAVGAAGIGSVTTKAATITRETTTNVAENVTEKATSTVGAVGSFAESAATKVASASDVVVETASSSAGAVKEKVSVAIAGTRETVSDVVDSAERSVEKVLAPRIKEKTPEVENQLDVSSEIGLEEALSSSLDETFNETINMESDNIKTSDSKTGKANSPADDDMKKILDELTAELK